MATRTRSPAVSDSHVTAVVDPPAATCGTWAFGPRSSVTGTPNAAPVRARATATPIPSRPRLRPNATVAVPSSSIAALKSGRLRTWASACEAPRAPPTAPRRTSTRETPS